MAKQIFYGWWVVAAMFPITLYVGGVVFYGFTAFFEPLIKEFGWSYAQLSFAASLRGLEAGILAPFVGFLVDRLGSRKLVLGGIIITGAGLILLSLTQSLTMFYGAFLLLALGAGGCMGVVSLTAVASWFEKNVGKAFAVMSSAFGASGLFVPFVVWLIDAFHWRTALIILGVGLWSLGIPLSFVVRNKPKRQDPLWDGEHPGQPVSSQQIQAKKVEFGLRDVMKNRSFIYLILIETIRMMAVSAVILHVMPCLCHAGVSRPTAGLIAAFLPVWSIAGRFVFGWIADVFEKKYVMAMAYFFMCVGLVGFSYVQVKWLMFLFVLLYPLGFGGAMVVRGVLLRDYFGTASFGSMLGIVMGTASVGGMIGPTLAGWVFDSIGSYQFIWLVLSGLTFLATVMTLGMRKP